MKRLIALVLVVLMLGSTAAFAADDNASLTVGDDSANFLSNGTTASQKTDLWIQVEAAGQIDVTVPLVLVFKTNIDGGYATTGTNYAITNNSTSDLAVTTIALDVESQTEDNTVNPMALVNAGSTLAEDQYEVQLEVEDVVNSQGETVETEPFDLYDIETATDSAISKPALEGGLFVLPSADDQNNSDNITVIDVQMKTGKLSFITAHSAENDLDETKGVKLLSVSYTVAINTATGIGEAIEGETTGTSFAAGATNPTTYTYDYPNTPAQGGSTNP